MVYIATLVYRAIKKCNSDGIEFYFAVYRSESAVMGFSTETIFGIVM